MPVTTTAPTDDFVAQADSYRRELLAHCYRMLGSLQDAEDLVQETYLKAWRSYAGFEGRSSLRTWLYKIATTTCLTALEGRKRRPLPSGLGAPTDEVPREKVVESGEVPWLQPIPDGMIADQATDPASIVGLRESTRLAFIAALQHLPARQRAVLILRDVLKWRAAEVADALHISTAAVNSVLQRARAQLADAAPSEDDRPQPLTAEQEQLLERYVAAFEAKDVDAIVGLFTAEAVWEMPPFELWVRGGELIAQLTARQCPAGPDGLRLRPTRANGQLAYGVYIRCDDDVFRPFQLHVLELDDERVGHVVCFFDVDFARFGLPESVSS
ncbi:sigma-70 family RNA polymerase sigma factor [Saccharopolyspora sp. TS4A08]|uniref:RNA polymerase sigma factor n=1 Tax=Saccharopolyspora ipomoeae TaxID=3042027 RepID=A0ABT6PJA3_9PSEU|nr:sigma-70 family RNA polymerase sigma factor [Saccharopolyspora sp. TS4A08]MDI2028084.1 sigma-70 family RNA polymerase sigma factor [Saccharopolyspora sp. TS4A08]